MRSLSYNGRLSVLGLERLELRRICADLTMCFKIVHHLVDIPFDMFFKFAGSTSTRGHPLKLLYPDARINARAHALSLYGLCYLPISNNLKWQSKTLTFRMHLLVKIEFKNSSRYAIFRHLSLFCFYTHCFLVCLLHYVCDVIYTCVLSAVLLVLALSRS